MLFFTNRLTTVDLPLVPVIPIIGFLQYLQNKSISLEIVMCFSLIHLIIGSLLMSIPGLIITCVIFISKIFTKNS